MYLKNIPNNSQLVNGNLNKQRDRTTYELAESGNNKTGSNNTPQRMTTRTTKWTITITRIIKMSFSRGEQQKPLEKIAKNCWWKGQKRKGKGVTRSTVRMSVTVRVEQINWNTSSKYMLTHTYIERGVDVKDNDSANILRTIRNWERKKHDRTNI